jgi:hypothetical protein
MVVMLVLMMEDTKYAVEMDYGGMIYLLSFMKIGTGIQAILWFCPRFETL